MYDNLDLTFFVGKSLQRSQSLLRSKLKNKQKTGLCESTTKQTHKVFGFHSLNAAADVQAPKLPLI